MLSGSLEDHRVALPAPARNARAQWTERASIILRLRDDEGHTGVGEASPLPGYSRDTLDRARATLRALRWKQMAASLALDPKRIFDFVERHVADSPAARFAVETALLDLLAQRRRVPLWRLLANEPEPIALAAWIDEPDARASVAAAHRAVDAGFATLKLKLGRHLDLELAVARTLRRELGPDIALRFDANRSLANRAPRVLDALAELNAEMIEEPVALERLSEWTGAPLPVALDESLQDDNAEPRVVSLLDRGLASVLVLKPMALGGFGACLRWAELAHRRGSQVVVSHLLDGPIAWHAATALAIALGGTLAHGLGPHRGLRAFCPALEVGPTVEPSKAAGLGMTSCD